MALVLYHNDMSVCAAKVRMALAEKDIAWEGVHLNLRAGDAQTPEYIELNPGKVVPTLVHDGIPIIESNVICEYIEDVWRERPTGTQQATLAANSMSRRCSSGA
jgi:glutathione S-transferase